MTVPRWFDRTFDLGLRAPAAPALFKRLRETPSRLEGALRATLLPLRVHRPDGRWSIQEHAGHLLDLEPLWLARLDDFDAGRAALHPADLQNRRTHEARHNDRDPAAIAVAFRDMRGQILQRLGSMTSEALERTALHRRLQQPMSVVDLCFFVAEHDDHHLDAIARIAGAYSGYPAFALELLASVERTVDGLKDLDDERAARRPAPGKWSPREILGHLIDSASNNHQRFVRACFQDSLEFVGYGQDEWVKVQHYQDAPWKDLLTLWASFNRHLARLMSVVPEAVRRQPHQRHNLHLLAFNPVPAEAPANLEYFMEDYVRHLQHHVRQIEETSGSQAAG